MRIIYLALCIFTGVSFTNAVAAKSADDQNSSLRPLVVEKKSTTKSTAVNIPNTSKVKTKLVAKAVVKGSSKHKSRHASNAKAHSRKAHGEKVSSRHAKATAATDSSSLSVAIGDEHTYEGLLPDNSSVVSMPSFTNDRGRAECVELIKGLMDAPRTAEWREGRRLQAGFKSIKPGTAIATFVKGHYPQGRRHGPHAAIFLRATEAGIYVMDQFATQIGVQQRFIPWHHPSNKRPSNNATAYSTVRW